MVLRSDEAQLYHFDRSRSQGGAIALQLVTVMKFYCLLWVILPMLVAIAFPDLKEAMFVAAIVLLVDLLWRCWATRKIGRLD
jgi:hypothetical protein